jgi:hypothetical protein
MNLIKIATWVFYLALALVPYTYSIHILLTPLYTISYISILNTILQPPTTTTTLFKPHEADHPECYVPLLPVSLDSILGWNWALLWLLSLILRIFMCNQTLKQDHKSSHFQCCHVCRIESPRTIHTAMDWAKGKCIFLKEKRKCELITSK